MWTLIVVVLCLLFVLTVTWLSYSLGRRKTKNPLASGVVGFLLSLVPPLGLIYLMMLFLKDEVPTI